jgi:hypothetical protein
MENSNQFHHQQTFVVVGKQKSVGTAFLLAFLFGPIGLLYSSIIGGIVMFILSIIVGIITLGLGLFFVWFGCIIWAVIAANYTNQNAMKGMSINSSISSTQTSSNQSEKLQNLNNNSLSRTEIHNSSTDIFNWFEKNKKSILVIIGGIFLLLLIILAIKFIVNIDFSKNNSEIVENENNAKEDRERNSNNDKNTDIKEKENGDNKEDFQEKRKEGDGLSKNEVKDFMDKWLDCQNQKKLANYSSFYSEDFEGIKRTKSGRTYRYDLSKWVSDRTKMYTAAKNLNISISNIDIDIEDLEATVKFSQDYRSLKYNDVGKKIIKLRKLVNGNIEIYYEELLYSTVD